MSAGLPPKSVTTLLRLEGGAVLAAMLFAYQSLGGNWWLFALFILVPDLAMLGFLAGNKAGSMIYNLAHAYFMPLLLAGLAIVTSHAWLLPFAAILAAHIGADRALGYGLKYPNGFETTHLGPIGRARKSANADAS